MRKCQLYLFFLILIFNPTIAFSQAKMLQLQLDGKKYEVMYLEANLYGLKSESLDIKGQSLDGSNWKFNIPDSIISHTQWCNIRTSEYDSEQKKIQRVVIDATLDGDTIKGRTGRLLFRYDDKMPILKMKYIKSEVIDVSRYRVNDSLTIENGQLIYDHFLLSPIVEGSDFQIGLENPQISTPYFYNDDQALVRALDSLSQKYPDSHYLMSIASVYTVSRANKSEKTKIYNNFSKENKNTYWGRRLKKYLETFPFQNMELPVTNNPNTKESIVVNPIKYNLIVFSASWCTPCRKEIPVLKLIYDDLKEKLDIVYVSIDEIATVATWRDLLQTESIPWRSLDACKDIEEVIQRYNMFFGIPYCLLVHPDGRAESIDVRKAEDKQQLYQVVDVGTN